MPVGVLALRFRLAEAEGRLMGHMDTSATQLEFLEARLRRALASKNDVIDELKDELGRREAEIFEARSILAGLATEAADGHEQAPKSPNGEGNCTVHRY
ncbi:unnamed protein product [Symbiodinium sp. CCMP2592]|nr:unnamed protein product [Symbiodinium sp. CCMP2592]